jgi:chemotaxis protein methyltransferase CheR
MNIVASNEFAFTQQDFDLIARLLYNETGITLDNSKVNLVYSRLTKRLRALGIESFRDYCALVSDSGNEEFARMCAALTTNVTRFFRERHHFDHLKAKILPSLTSAARAGKKIRIWSAGCSSGEEAYSTALTILSVLPAALSYDIRILATDINPDVLATGRAGVYPASGMDEVDPALRSKWMESITINGEKHYRLDYEVRSLVSFKHLNLMGQWPMKGPFQVVFCRNVVIYFDAPTQARIWSRMLPLIDKSGVLYIGHSERVSGPAMSQVQADGSTIYRKIARAAA